MKYFGHIFEYNINLDKDNFEKIIKDRAKKSNIKIYLKKGNLQLTKTEIVTGGQGSFNARYIMTNNYINIRGYWGLHKYFYIAFSCLTFLLLFVFLSLSDFSVSHSIFVCLLMTIAMAVTFLLANAYSIVCFHKQNQMVVDFLETLEKDYS